MRQSVLEIKDLANRAGQGISMDPERMGASLLQECDNGLNVFLAQIPEEMQEEYEKLRISLQWYRCSGRMVPRGADAWYHLYRSDGTGTKPPLHTLLSHYAKER